MTNLIFHLNWLNKVLLIFAKSWKIKPLWHQDKLLAGLMNLMTILKTNSSQQKFQRGSMQLLKKLRTWNLFLTQSNYHWSLKNSNKNCLLFRSQREVLNLLQREQFLLRMINFDFSSYTRHPLESNGTLMINWIRFMNNGTSSCRSTFWMLQRV